LDSVFQRFGADERLENGLQGAFPGACFGELFERFRAGGFDLVEMNDQPRGGPLLQVNAREVVSGPRQQSKSPVEFDQLPFQKGPDGVGVATPWNGPYPYAFGGDPNDSSRVAWEAPLAFRRRLRDLGMHLVCLTAASPYYNPHLQRPAAVPPSDGYLPPEDPLAGVARQVNAVARVKREFPDLLVVGSAYSYLQDWLPHIGDALLANGMADFVGLGRMVLGYPELPRGVLAGNPLQRRKVCRTFSECTTGPRNGLVSGCFPLDEFYRRHPDAAKLKALRS
jgi:hypothetical protein